MSDVFQNEIGWHYSGQWWIWVLVMTVFVFLLTYRDIRLSTTTGVILGAFEIAIFGALALWMIFSNTGRLNLQPFNPHHAGCDWSVVFKGMVFAILAFIGFEAAAPLGEEAKNPRRTVPIAVVGSAIVIGIFYVLCSYAWVFGAGFDNFVNQATTNADPWRALGKTFWAGGWVLVFLAICNSIAANSNAGMKRGHAGLLRARPEQAGTASARPCPSEVQDAVERDHRYEPLRVRPRHPVRLEVGTAQRLLHDRDDGGAAGDHRLHARRAGIDGLSPRPDAEGVQRLLHVVLTIGGIVLFLFPLYHQFVEYPPVYPEKYGNWVDYGWLVLGIALTVFLAIWRPGKIKDMERVYVDDETVTGSATAPDPA